MALHAELKKLHHMLDTGRLGESGSRRTQGEPAQGLGAEAIARMPRTAPLQLEAKQAPPRSPAKPCSSSLRSTRGAGRGGGGGEGAPSEGGARVFTEEGWAVFI